MAQGKTKMKKSLPSGVKAKKKVKGAATTRRSNAPVPHKRTATQRCKLKKAVSKMVNAAAEEQLRARAVPRAPPPSAAQAAAAAAPTRPQPQ